MLISAADYVSYLKEEYPDMDEDKRKCMILSFLEGYLRCDMYFKRIDMLYFDEVLMKTFDKCMNFLNKQHL